MKKFLILPILITPMVAKADNVGPAAVGQGETPVVATASAPYATASDQPGDSTTVVSASYVKGAYNDTIAAINKLDKNIEAFAKDVYEQIAVMPLEVFDVEEDVAEGPISAEVLKRLSDVTQNNELVTGMAVKNAIDSVNSTISNKRVSAVTTWGNDTPTQLTLTTASN